MFAPLVFRDFFQPVEGFARVWIYFAIEFVEAQGGPPGCLPIFKFHLRCVILVRNNGEGVLALQAAVAFKALNIERLFGHVGLLIPYSQDVLRNF